MCDSPFGLATGTRVEYRIPHFGGRPNGHFASGVLRNQAELLVT